MIFIDAATSSLNGVAKPVEMYIPLWFENGISSSSINATTSGRFLADGSQGMSTTASTSSVSLFTLNSNWPATTKFSLEATIYTANASAIAYVSLWDLTAGSVVYTSTVNTSSTTAVIVRSSQFTLTTGHAYGVTVYTNNTSYSAYITDASLIIFP